MAKIVEDGKITPVPDTQGAFHVQNVRSGWITLSLVDFGRYWMISYNTPKGLRTLFVWP